MTVLHYQNYWIVIRDFHVLAAGENWPSGWTVFVILICWGVIQLPCRLGQWLLNKTKRVTLQTTAALLNYENTVLNSCSSHEKLKQLQTMVHTHSPKSSTTTNFCGTPTQPIVRVKSRTQHPLSFSFIYNVFYSLISFAEQGSFVKVHYMTEMVLIITNDYS